MLGETEYDDAEAGQCSVCGYRGVFQRNHKSIREGYRCRQCRAALRYRHQASVLLSKYASAGSRTLADLVEEPEFRELRVYEPGITGPFREYFKGHPNYTTSYLWEGVELGDVKNGVRCEDLERLTFDDDSFDLVITSDIFEHIRRPYKAFAEIYRVLKPGGATFLPCPCPGLCVRRRCSGSTPRERRMSSFFRPSTTVLRPIRKGACCTRTSGSISSRSWGRSGSRPRWTRAGCTTWPSARSSVVNSLGDYRLRPPDA